MPTHSGNTYRHLSGTSQATPLVSGTATLLLSAISQLTGNATGRAAEVRALLLESATDHVEGSPFASVNAQAAMQAVLRRYAPAGAALVPLQPADQPLPSSSLVTVASAVSVTTSGMAERYYPGTGPTAWQGSPYDSSARSLRLPLTNFKHGAGFTVRFSATASLSSPGLHILRVGHPAAIVLVNGQPAAKKAVREGTQAMFQTREQIGVRSGLLQLRLTSCCDVIECGLI